MSTMRGRPVEAILERQAAEHLVRRGTRTLEGGALIFSRDRRWIHPFFCPITKSIWRTSSISAFWWLKTHIWGISKVDPPTAPPIELGGPALPHWGGHLPSPHPWGDLCYPPFLIWRLRRSTGQRTLSGQPWLPASTSTTPSLNIRFPSHNNSASLWI